MEIVRCAQDEGIDLVELKEGVRVHHRRDTEAPGEGFGFVQVRIRDRDHVNVRTFGENGKVDHLAHRTCADDANSDR
jgi:hypothetical protein